MDICKIACAVALAFGVAFAKGNDSNVLTKGKYILTYEQSYNDVWTYGDAKLTKTICKVKVDIQHMLLETALCDVKKVAFYTKDSIWLGNLRLGLLSDEDSFDAGYSYSGIYHSST